jgi:mannosyl-3-phosphoglycerate phosphatase
MDHDPSVVVFANADCVSTTSASKDAGFAPFLRMTARSGIPLVLCSTRTRAELESLQQELGLQHPFLCENGAAVFVPYGYFGFAVPGARVVSGYEVIELGRPYPEVVDALHRTAGESGVDVVGFNDMSIEDIADAGGVSLLEARLAKLREYSELFRIPGAQSSRRQRLFRALWTRGHGCTTGGRYDYVGSPFDEGAGIDLIRRLYRRTFSRVVTAGCGDPAEDSALLERVDIPIAVPRANRADAPTIMKLPAAQFSVNPGVGGWIDDMRWFARMAGRRIRLTRTLARWA